MPDKLTDSEIIKALECCSEENKCRQCPYYNKGNFKCLNYKFFKDLLDLINRLQAENERLKKSLKEQGKRLAIERGQKYEQIDIIIKLKDQLITAKAEAYKEFADRLKRIPSADKDVQEIFEERIDNLLKKLVGDNND